MPEFRVRLAVTSWDDVWVEAPDEKAAAALVEDPSFSYDEALRYEHDGGRPDLDILGIYPEEP